MIPTNRAFNCLATIPVDFSKRPDSFSVAIEEKGFRVRDPRITHATFLGEKVRLSVSASIDLLEFPPDRSMRYVMRAMAHYGLKCLNVLELAEMARDPVILRVFAVLEKKGRDWKGVQLLGLGSLFGGDPEKYPAIVAFAGEEILIKEIHVHLFVGNIETGWLVPVFEK